MNDYAFVPDFRTVAHFDGRAGDDELSREVGVYAAPIAFVRERCGPLAQRFLDAVPAEYLAMAEEAGLSANCDVRLHRLERGDYPASPGWHCDAALRETAFSDESERVAISNSLIGSISSAPAGERGISTTEFLTGPSSHTSEVAYNTAPFWAEVSSAADAALVAGSNRAVRAEDGQLTMFSCDALHRATPATRAGWRLFFRMSLWAPPVGHRPGISRGEQVYRLWCPS